MRIRNLVLIGSLMFWLLSFTACSVLLGDQSATDEVPISASTEEVSIPYDASRPKFVVAVEPFQFNDKIGESEVLVRLDQSELGRKIAGQLSSALVGAENLGVIDSGFKKKSAAFYKKKVKKGEVGPFIIKAIITEFSEEAEVDKSKLDIALGWLGTALVFAGEIADKPALTWTGAGVAIANPTIKSEKEIKTGVVSIEFQVYDAVTARLFTSFRSSATFASGSAEAALGLFGVDFGEKEEAKSVLGQALRVALNDAVIRLDSKLKQKYPAVENLSSSKQQSRKSKADKDK